MKIVMTFDLKMTKQEFDDSFNSWRNTFEMESNTPMTVVQYLDWNYGSGLKGNIKYKEV
jgi:hypothetical protein